MLIALYAIARLSVCLSVTLCQMPLSVHTGSRWLVVSVVEFHAHVTVQRWYEKSQNGTNSLWYEGYEKSTDATKNPWYETSTVRKVHLWYETSMVRKVWFPVNFSTSAAN